LKKTGTNAIPATPVSATIQKKLLIARFAVQKR